MLTLDKRDLSKKAESYRQAGKVPGIIYGPGIEPMPVVASSKAIEDLVKKHPGGLFDFQLGESRLSGMLKAVDAHPVTAKPLHFDIYMPRLDKPVTASVKLEFVGVEQLEKLGLFLNKATEELELECLPRLLPEKIRVDVSGLKEAHQSLYVKDLRLPAGIKVLVSVETPVATVLPVSELTEVEAATASGVTEEAAPIV